MYKIISPRQSGKTTALIALSEQTGKYIVCQDKRHVENVWMLAQRQGVNIPFPVTIDELKDCRGGSIPRDGILIDDLDTLMQHLLYKATGGVPVHGYTATNNSLL